MGRSPPAASPGPLARSVARRRRHRRPYPLHRWQQRDQP
ncbi:protein of unknown function [Blastococcus saxobsidens DD2]|uniref:Uncharacterized protein n=1 Tax=Blastococcus saxobsidens (strain DD2) TaxID=1146883 RepID=H6RQC7_BLASD|nr:protein of unknown function [Blastococcus saxobsidens DD2]